MAHDNKSLAHTTWNCKYHIVFAPKNRRKVFFGEKREAIGKNLRQLTMKELLDPFTGEPVTKDKK